MMKKFLRGFLLFVPLVLCPFSRAEIREIKSMSEIISSIDDETLLVFDLDNTLIEPEGNLGSDQWYRYLIRKYVEIDGLSEKDANAKAMKLWNKVQWIIKIKVVENDTPMLIKQQQDPATKIRPRKIMGFTARTPGIADKTLQQLESIGVRFQGRSAVHDKDVELRFADVAQFKQGVLFVGEMNDKGKSLLQFLRRINYTPKKIVFVDDRLKNVESVKKALATTKITHIEFRYGATSTVQLHSSRQRTA
jgi:Protein of unknown function (DUF2608)